ncbi:unnamed protein product [Ixodes hexagonus]
MANPVDTPAVTPDDEADDAAPSENQPPPLPEVSALVVELQARVAEQAAQLFLGSMSDRECVRQSGFLKLPFDEKDSVMADKGFLISDLLEEINVKLNIPPFLGQGTFTEAQVKETENIASLRINVERRIQRNPLLRQHDAGDGD